MADSAIQVYEGAESNLIQETLTNVPGQMTPALRISPDRGNLIRVLNMVSRGEQIGVPVYMKLKDTDGNDLPVDTTLQWEYSPSNSDSRYRVSRQVSNLAFYNNNTLSEQADVDKIDKAKQTLTEPEFEGQDAVRFLQWSDIEDVFVSIESSKEIDWANSIFEVEPSAIKGPFNRGR